MDQANPPRYILFPDTNRISQIIDEEDKIELKGCCSSKTWRFLIPCKRHFANIFLHSTMAAAASMAAGHFLMSKFISDILGGDPGGGVVLSICIFGWFSVLQALHALIIISPPETATFRAHDSLEIGYMSRSVHVILLTVPHFIALIRCKEYDLAEAGVDPRPPEALDDLLFYGKVVGYIAIPMLPILWVVGILPPLEPLLLWLMEQVQVFLFGGSAAASTKRAIVQLAISVIPFAIVTIVVTEDVKTVVIFAGLAGYVMSLDWYGLFDLVKNRGQSPTAASISRSTSAIATQQQQQSSSSRK